MTVDEFSMDGILERYRALTGGDHEHDMTVALSVMLDIGMEAGVIEAVLDDLEMAGRTRWYHVHHALIQCALRGLMTTAEYAEGRGPWIAIEKGKMPG